MSGCKDFQKIMQTVLDRTAAEKERACLEEHMNLCRNCAMEYKALQLSLDLLVSMPVPEPHAEFTSETVKKAFKAKKLLAHRRRIISLCLSLLPAIISSFIFAGWSLVLQPAIRRGLLSVVRGLSQCSGLLTAFDKMVSVISSVLWVLGSAIYKIVCSGCNPGFLYLTAIIIMIFFVLISGEKSPAFLLNRR
jgi:hypothetical protein